MMVSFVVPVRRDRRLPFGLRRLREFVAAEEIDAEILTCGELLGSSDQATADRHIDIRPAAKGRCVRHGVLASRGSVIVVIDADVPIEYDDMRRLIKATDTCDVVVGKRFGSGTLNASRPLTRQLASSGLRTIIATLFHLQGVDVQSGAKAYRRSAARNLFERQTVCGLGYDLEVLLRARELRMRVEQVPVAWSHGESSISLWTSVPAVTMEVLGLFMRGLVRTRTDSDDPSRRKAESKPNKALQPTGAARS